jgi:lipoyl(octanoyl) transferase
MDLAPFAAINPCGYEGLAVTQVAELCGVSDIDRVGDRLIAQLERTL